MIGTAIIILAKHVNKRPVHSKGNTGITNNKTLNHSIEASWPGTDSRGNYHALRCEDNNQRGELGQDAYDENESENESYYTEKEDSWSDLEVDDELVEDQLLPDSELKSGLELLFLKQQRHYWNQKRRHNQSRESIDK